MNFIYTKRMSKKRQFRECVTNIDAGTPCTAKGLTPAELELWTRYHSHISEQLFNRNATVGVVDLMIPPNEMNVDEK